MSNDETQKATEYTNVYPSPFDDHPGDLVFPKRFKGKLYKAWRQAAAPQTGDVHDPTMSLEANFRATLSIAESFPQGIGKNTDFDDLGVDVLTWIADCGNIYCSPFFKGMYWRVLHIMSKRGQGIS